MKPAEVAFGRSVIVSAQVARVLGKLAADGDTPMFRQTNGRRDSGRFVEYDFEGAAWWPGEPIPTSWQAAPPDYPLEPDPLETPLPIRLRRLPMVSPEVGIIIGRARRQEGQVRVNDDDRELAGPGRSIQLAEVALQVNARNGRARIILAHAGDLQTLPARR